MYPNLKPEERSINRFPSRIDVESGGDVYDWLRLFHKYDSNSDGFIPVGELRQSIHESATSFGLSDRQQLAFFDRIDQNGDQLVDFAEFCTLMARAKKYRLRHVMFRAAQLVIPRKQREEPFSYLQQYNCIPPPLFLLSATLLQVHISIHSLPPLIPFHAFPIGIYVFYVVKMNYGISISGPVPTQSPLIYDSMKREQIWRFLSYMFIHIGILHIVFNSLSQLILGIPLELVHKPWRIGLVYLIGVIAGSLSVSFFDPGAYLAGASGGVYALLAAHVSNLVINWDEMEFAIVRTFVMLLLIGSDLGMSIYNRLHLDNDNKVSYMAHLGGFLAGLLLGVVVLRNFRLKTWERFVWWLAIIALIALLLFGIAWNVIPFLD